MIGGKNPFRNLEDPPLKDAPPGAPEPVVQPEGKPRRRLRWGWVFGVALLLASLGVAGGLADLYWQQRQTLVSQAWALSESHGRNRALRETLSKLERERELTLTRLAAAQDRSQELRAEVQRLEQEQQTITEAQRRLESEMRTALESRDVTISELAGKLTVNILDRVLFASGEAEITAEGQAVLRKVAEVLGQFPDRQIQVIGHTDNVPIRTVRFPSNWELAAARATAAVRFLSEQAGVDPKRLGALGYGEFHPVADNATAEGRAKNRRIAIVVLPELLVATTEAHFKGSLTALPAAGLSNGADAAPTVSAEKPAEP
jgi:chemotaxis protein MotB